MDGVGPLLQSPARLIRLLLNLSVHGRSRNALRVALSHTPGVCRLPGERFESRARPARREIGRWAGPFALASRRPGSRSRTGDRPHSRGRLSHIPAYPSRLAKNSPHSFVFRLLPQPVATCADRHGVEKDDLADATARAIARQILRISPPLLQRVQRGERYVQSIAQARVNRNGYAGPHGIGGEA